MVEPPIPPEQHLPSVTVLVTTKNNQDTIRECVQSLLNLNYPQPKLKIMILDASTNNSTGQALQGTDVPILEFRGNAPSAYNFGLRQTDSDLVGFVDGDAVVDPDWLTRIVEQVDTQGIAGAGGPVRTWNKEKIIPRCVGYELEARYNSPGTFTRASTTNLVLKRSVIAEVGGFDESLDTGYDADIGYRLRKIGHKIAFVDRAPVYHSHRQTFRSYFRQQYLYAKNDIVLYRKDSGLVKTDNVTSKWMVIQPPVILLLSALAITSLLLSRLTSVSPLALQALTVSGITIGLALVVGYLFSSARLAIQSREAIAFPVLFCIFSIRAIAWTTGGIVGLIGQSKQQPSSLA